MWKSTDGVAHTVALPDPRSAMSDDFVASVAALDATGRNIFWAALEDLEDRLPLLLEDVAAREPGSPDVEGLPDQYLSGPFTTPADLVTLLSSLDLRWRLDAYLAVDDLLDILDDA